jgi:hypothetical protein
VEGEAIDLDDEPLVQPHRVDLVAADADIRRRRSEARLRDQIPEPPLRFRSCDAVRCSRHRFRRGAQRLRSPVAASLVNGLGEGGVVELSLDQRFLDRAPELVVGRRRGEVPDRPLWHGRRDASHARHVLAERASMDPHSRSHPRVTVRHGHVDPLRAPGEPVQRGRGAVARHRPWPAGQDRSHHIGE